MTTAQRDSRANQRGDEWKAARIGKVTASKFKAVMGGSTGRTSYLMELIAETLCDRPVEDFSAKATNWGNDHEDEARTCYEFDTGNTVDLVGFVQHPDFPLCGCSPDGVIGDDGGMQIKCPATRREHARTIVTQKVPSEHVPQIQGELWCTKRKWWEFVSYHPDFPDELQLVVVRVTPDAEYIKQLETAAGKFCSALRRALAQVAEQTGMPF